MLEPCERAEQLRDRRNKKLTDASRSRFQFGDSSDNVVPMGPGYPAVLEDEGAVTAIAAMMASSACAKAESMGQAQPEQNVCDDAESSGEC